MKSRKPHTVLLSKQARSVLEDVKRFNDGRAHVFPGMRDPQAAMSQMTLLACLKDIAPGFTVHGFRSSFSTWAHSKGLPPSRRGTLPSARCRQQGRRSVQPLQLR